MTDVLVIFRSLRASGVIGVSTNHEGHEGSRRNITDILQSLSACIQRQIRFQRHSPARWGEKTMLGIGEKFPSYSLTATVETERDPQKAFRTITDLDYAGKWKVYFFWPKDFMFICPTEIADFAKFEKEFEEREAQVLGASIDSEWVHHAWRNTNPELRDVPFPMLSDIKRELCAQLGILDPVAGVAQRATFIVNPEGVIQFVYVTNSKVGRNPEEVLRVLDALQSDELCPSNWHKGEPTLKVA
jgi:alkyl hydroperoxide reductase subunit AhpC